MNDSIASYRNTPEESGHSLARRGCAVAMSTRIDSVLYFEDRSLTFHCGEELLGYP